MAYGSWNTPTILQDPRIQQNQQLMQFVMQLAMQKMSQKWQSEQAKEEADRALKQAQTMATLQEANKIEAEKRQAELELGMGGYKETPYGPRGAAPYDVEAFGKRYKKPEPKVIELGEGTKVLDLGGGKYLDVSKAEQETWGPLQTTPTGDMFQQSSRGKLKEVFKSSNNESDMEYAYKQYLQANNLTEQQYHLGQYKQDHWLKKESVATRKNQIVNRWMKMYGPPTDAFGKMLEVRDPQVIKRKAKGWIKTRALAEESPLQLFDANEYQQHEVGIFTGINIPVEVSIALEAARMQGATESELREIIEREIDRLAKEGRYTKKR